MIRAEQRTEVQTSSVKRIQLAAEVSVSGRNVWQMRPFTFTLPQLCAKAQASPPCAPIVRRVTLQAPTFPDSYLGSRVQPPRRLIDQSLIGNPQEWPALLLKSDMQLLHRIQRRRRKKRQRQSLQVRMGCKTMVLNHKTKQTNKKKVERKKKQRGSHNSWMN